MVDDEDKLEAIANKEADLAESINDAADNIQNTLGTSGTGSGSVTIDQILQADQDADTTLENAMTEEITLLNTFNNILTGVPSYVYVTKENDTPGTVSVIDMTSNTVVNTINVGTSPFSITIRPDGKFAYAVNKGSDDISAIDTSTFAVTTIPVGTSPVFMAIRRNGTRGYVVNQGSMSVSVIDTTTNTFLTNILVGNSPSKLTITPDGLFLYVINQADNTVTVIDTTTNTPITTIIAGNMPSDIITTP